MLRMRDKGTDAPRGISMVGQEGSWCLLYRSAQMSQRESTDRIRRQQWERGTQFHQPKELIVVSSEARK